MQVNISKLHAIKTPTTLFTTCLYSLPLNFIPWGKKWGGICTTFLNTPRNIAIHRKHVEKSMHNHLSFIRMTFWFWSEFFSSEKKKAKVFQTLDVSILLNKRFVWVRLLSFIFADMNCLSRITYDLYWRLP